MATNAESIIDDRTTIQISRENATRLNEISKNRLTYDETITKLLDVWDIVRKEWLEEQNKH